MRILGYVTHAWPHQRGGSETSFHHLAAWLAARGHDVRVLVTRHRATPLDGVDYAQRSSAGQHAWWDWCDVALSQSASTTNACLFAAQYGKPVAHWAHNWHYADLHLSEMNPARDLVAWNSRVLSVAQGDRWEGRSMVLHPPTFSERWHGGGANVLQVNLSALKGGHLFWKLARTMSHLSFVGVGGWGDQVIGEASNVTVIPSTPDMDAVYRQARILIVPTVSTGAQRGESWGMAAAEAAAAGIPVVASRSPGMVEQFGDAAIWCDPSDPAQWVDALERLQDPAEWARASAAVQTRTVDPTDELEAFEGHLAAMCGALV